MAKTSSEVHSALSDALQKVHEEQLRSHEFGIAVQALQKQALQDLENSTSAAKSYLARIVKSMETVLQNMVNGLSTAIGAMETDVAGLNEVRAGIARPLRS